MKNQITLTQSPIIKHDLLSIGANVTKRIDELNVENLVVTVDTIKSMKSLRAELNKEAKEFGDMRYDLGGNSYLYNHTTTFSLPDPSHGQSQGGNWTGELSLYIKGSIFQ